MKIHLIDTSFTGEFYFIFTILLDIIFEALFIYSYVYLNIHAKIYFYKQNFCLWMLIEA